MEVRCDKCQARYRVDDARIGPQGLTMRCGKCQNTFKVTRAEAQPTVPDQAPVPPAPKPAAVPKPAARPAEPANATMVFGQAPVAASKPAMPTARPAAGKPAAVSRPATPAAAPSEEGAGRTMMFQTGNIKAPAAKAKPGPDSGSIMALGQSPLAKPAAPPAPRPAAKPAESDSGSTMVFGQSPLAKSAVAAVMAKPAARPAKDDTAGSTMMFGQSPAQAKPATPAKPMPAPIPAPVAEPEPVSEPEAAAPEAASEPEAPQEAPAHDDDSAHEESAAGSGVEAEGAEETTEAAGGGSTFDKAPPRGLLIGVAAGLAALLIAGGALVAVKKLGKHAPPPAAVETLTAAQGDADKDSLASIAAAEGKAKDALDAAGAKSYFPQATATLASIEIQWADALNDQANLVTQKGGDGSDTRAAELQAQAKARLKTAFETLSPAIKADQKSPELQLALADYYRAQRSGSNMNKAIKSAQALKADDARVAQVQGMALGQEEDGGEKAIPKLKAALAGSPQSARLHFRLALAYLSMKDEANTSAELKETLKLSPQHERARAAQELLAPAASGK